MTELCCGGLQNQKNAFVAAEYASVPVITTTCAGYSEVPCVAEDKSMQLVVKYTKKFGVAGSCNQIPCLADF
eukprot:247712-Pyramimonas_sp.AAC.1